jgi:CheY-like chemotaxis protein
MASILLVEDDPANQKVTLLILKKLGYQADAVNNGLEALQALEKIQYDIVLMDILMPEMDGITATQEIRRIWPNGPKIIALTAYLMPNGREKCLEVGMDDYIIKPVSVSESRDVLNAYRTPYQRDSSAQVNAHEKSWVK